MDKPNILTIENLVREQRKRTRLRKEKELFKEYGVNKKLYYILNHPSPTDELKKLLIYQNILDGA